MASEIETNVRELLDSTRETSKFHQEHAERLLRDILDELTYVSEIGERNLHDLDDVDVATLREMINDLDAALIQREDSIRWLGKLAATLPVKRTLPVQGKPRKTA
jgi:hypothetical protein